MKVVKIRGGDGLKTLNNHSLVVRPKHLRASDIVKLMLPITINVT